MLTKYGYDAERDFVASRSDSVQEFNRGLVVSTLLSRAGRVGSAAIPGSTATPRRWRRSRVSSLRSLPGLPKAHAVRSLRADTYLRNICGAGALFAPRQFPVLQLDDEGELKRIQYNEVGAPPPAI